jgi:hypothetical protein
MCVTRLFHCAVLAVPLLLTSTDVGALPDASAATQALYSDQVIVELPLDQAEIAAVALARLTIVLHRAKQRAADTLCHGRWPPDGATLQQFGPVVVAQSPGDAVWRYETIRRALPLKCNGVSRARFFMEMSRYLPAWVTVRPAGETTCFRQGSRLTDPVEQFANR